MFTASRLQGYKEDESESKMTETPTDYPPTTPGVFVNENASYNITATSDPDMDYNAQSRIVALVVMVTVGFLGNILVYLWMWVNRRKKSRVNQLILGLAVADLSVVTFTMLTQIIWESLDEVWLAGNVMCKVIKVLQVMGMMASSNMIVVIALDRHQAIRSPLKETFSAPTLILAAWGTALLSSLPQAYVFSAVEVDGEDIQHCKSIFGSVPLWHRQAYITYAATVLFLIPLIIIAVTYARILKKISDKVKEGKSSKRATFNKKGKVYLQSTGTGTLSKAKIKTLKMTIVIILTFFICGAPYFIIEMWMAFGDPSKLNPDVIAVLGIFASANTATNPFVFLYFNTTQACLKELGQADKTGGYGLSTKSTRIQRRPTGRTHLAMEMVDLPIIIRTRSSMKMSSLPDNETYTTVLFTPASSTVEPEKEK
ncbi:mesotocin receptor-like [Branchiostoma floridae]|uniref:Mesotocin receptor-like n=1 Tax=Branchiostoma floridae TaxID=7739 RepID=A0A9J7HGI8_BRAFL|nr:mesotocin receptor-like [Branchiostoma floridae]